MCVYISLPTTVAGFFWNLMLSYNTTGYACVLSPQSFFGSVDISQCPEARTISRQLEPSAHPKNVTHPPTDLTKSGLGSVSMRLYDWLRFRVNAQAMPQ